MLPGVNCMSSISRHLDFLVVKVIHGKTQELGNVEHTELGVCTKLPRFTRNPAGQTRW